MRVTGVEWRAGHVDWVTHPLEGVTQALGVRILARLHQQTAQLADHADETLLHRRRQDACRRTGPGSGTADQVL